MAQKKPPQSVIEYINHLKKQYVNLKKIYIFGSYIKGTDTIDSDIDIAAVFDNVDDPIELQIQLMKIRRQYNSRIEPHVLSTVDFEKSHPLAGEIMKTGTEIL